MDSGSLTHSTGFKGENGQIENGRARTWQGAGHETSLGTKYIKYDSENDRDPSWLSHSLHLIVLTYSGKPVYSRYGDEDMLSGLTGTLQSITSRFADTKDVSNNLKSIKAGDLAMHFLCKGPLIFVAITRKYKTSFCRKLLELFHRQFTVILTDAVEQSLNARPNFDPRSVLSGTKSIFGNLATWMKRDVNLSFSFPALEILPLGQSARRASSDAITRDLPSTCLLGLVLGGHRLVVTTQGSSYKSVTFEALDLLALINAILSSTALRSGENWTPFCLPSLDSRAFLHAYILFPKPGISIVFLSADGDSETFMALSRHAQAAVNTLEISGAMKEISDSLHAGAAKFADDGPVLRRVKHCAVALRRSAQFFSSRIISDSSAETKSIFQRYAKAQELLEGKSLPRQVWLTGEDFSTAVWATEDFELLITVPRGVSNSVTLLAYQWVKAQELRLFVPLKIPLKEAAVSSPVRRTSALRRLLSIW